MHRAAGLLALAVLFSCADSRQTTPPEPETDEQPTATAPGTCVPITCADAGASCGAITDGCGGILQCGTCPSNQTCGAAGPNKCGAGPCTKATCAAAGAECGTLTDGCGGLLSCGNCGNGLSCQSNRCVSTCSPKSCAQLGKNCGTIDDGCGNSIECGTCSGVETCGGNGVANQCGQAPPPCALHDLGSVDRFEIKGLLDGNGTVPGESVTPRRYGAWRWRAPRTGTYAFDTFTSVKRPSLAVRPGCSGPNLMADVMNRGYGYTTFTVNVTAGRWYLIEAWEDTGYVSQDWWIHASPMEQTESVCLDLMDSDLDGLTDCADPNCSGNTACFASACGARELGSVLASFMGDTRTGRNRYITDCGGSTGADGTEDVISWTAPHDGTFVFTTSAGHLLRVMRGCSGFLFACAQTIENPNLNGGKVTSATYDLTAGQHVLVSVENLMDASGQFPASGYALRIAEAKPENTVMECNDRLDNDGDGWVDCFDPDCAGLCQ